MMKINRKDIVISNITYAIFILAFALTNIGALVSMKIPIQTGLFVSLLSICLLLYLWVKISNSKNITYGNVYNIFILLELLSCFFGLFSQYGDFLQKHVVILFYGISYLLLPQLLFFNLGRCMEDSRVRQSLYFLLFCNVLLVFLGILFYVGQPQFYMNFLERVLPTQMEVYGFSPRLVSYLGDSMSIGVICSSSFILSYSYLKGKKRLFSCILFLIGCAMSMQRSAWISAILSFVLFSYLTKTFRWSLRLNKKKLFYILLFFIIVIILIYMIQDRWKDEFMFFDILTRRFNKIGGATSERSDQWLSVLEVAFKNIGGLGLGAMSHKGVNFGFPIVCPDGNYFRILGDIGPIGFFVFLLLNALSLLNVYRKRYYGLLCVIVIYLVQAVGTNVFDLFYSSFIYWFILGLSNRKSISLCVK